MISLLLIFVWNDNKLIGISSLSGVGMGEVPFLLLWFIGKIFTQKFINVYNWIRNTQNDRKNPTFFPLSINFIPHA